MPAESVCAAHSAVTEDVGTSRLEEQLEGKTTRSQAHSKEAPYGLGLRQIRPKLVAAMSAAGPKCEILAQSKYFRIALATDGHRRSSVSDGPRVQPPGTRGVRSIKRVIVSLGTFEKPKRYNLGTLSR